MGQHYTRAGLNFLFSRAAYQKTLGTMSGTHTKGTNVITGISNLPAVLLGLRVGQMLAGQGTDGRYVVGWDVPSSTVFMNAPSTGTGTLTGAINFYSYYASVYPLWVNLLTGPIPTSPDATFTDLTFATYSGYIAQPILTFPVITHSKDGQFGVCQHDRMVFQPSDYSVPNYITGHAFIVSNWVSSPPPLVAVEIYPSAVPLLQEGDLLTVNPVLSWPFDCSAGPSGTRVA